MIYLYGIPNCGSVKKARKLLEDNNVAYTFVDFKKTPPSHEQIQHWIDKIGIKELINKQGTKWRSLTDEEKQQAQKEDTAISLIIKHPTLIKRPLIEWETCTWSDREISTGFDEDYIFRRAVSS